MNQTKLLSAGLAIVLGSVLLGFSISAQPAVSVGVSVPLPSVQVEIRAESDFYEPLAPHGEWVVVGSYGRCWRPAHVDRDWRPYCNGNWERTEAGWYWVSDEPWAWATYHYGRWDHTEQYGWYWVPQTQWSPAWVSWHSGGGYIGWAPLLPSVRVSSGGYVGFNAAIISPRAFVFVEQRRFLEPIRPRMVVINNTTIIKKTTVITNTRIVNNTVINEGPATTVIEKASGRKVQPVQVRELRQKQEAPVVTRQRAVAGEKKVQTPATREAKADGNGTIATPTPVPVDKRVAPAREAPAPALKNREAQIENRKSAPTPAEPTSAAKPERDRSIADKQPSESKPNQRVEKSEKSGKTSGHKGQRPEKGKPVANEKSGAGAGPEKEHENKPKN